jgi:hypothetical protein
MAMIRAAHYDATVDALKADPIIRGMAASLPADVEMDFGFTLAANAEYARRGGQVAAHIGGVKEALAAVLAERQ